MDEKLKPTPENINKDKIEQIPKAEFVPSEPLPMSQFLVEFEAKVHEQLEDNISGAITQIALENGIKYECAINKSFVVDALKKATATKPKNIITLSKPCACGCCDMDYLAGECPNCHEDVDDFKEYCGDCGQKLKWSDEDE